MRLLSDIVVTPIELIDALASAAPPPPAPPTPGPRRRDQQGDLGPLIMNKYLGRHGVEYDLKEEGGRRIYRLTRCFFDPAHGRNEAAIIQDVSGKITYHCKHNSCRTRTWSDAKSHISGDANLAEFCEGYSAKRDPAPSRPSAPPPPPDEGSGEENPFLIVSEKGKVHFVPAYCADHLEAELSPIVNEGKDYGGLFYRYDAAAGIWKWLPEANLLFRATKLLGAHAKTARITDTLNLLGNQTYKPPEELAPDPMWLNLRNCMLHVQTEKTAPHDKSFLSRVQLPVEYIEGARCDLWIETLMGIFADDTEKILTLQEFMGYCLYPKIIFAAAMFCIGPGGNGKGTVQFILESMLGNANICHISLQRMEEKFGPVELKDKLLNSCGETSTQALEVTRFKEISAADQVQAEVKYKADVLFTPIAKHYIAMNAFPGVKDKSPAFARRLIVMEFKQKFEGEKDDTSLKEKLLDELNGIFMWSLQGLRRILERPRPSIWQCDTVLQAKSRLNAWINPIFTFVDECLNQGDDEESSPPQIYRRYVKWVEEGRGQPMGKQRFYDNLLTNFPKIRKTRPANSTVELFRGISIRTDTDL